MPVFIGRSVFEELEVAGVSGIKCPKCGNTLEFYAKERYKGTCNFYFRTDGKITWNGEMYDHAEHKYRSKYIFCSVCDARAGTVDMIPT